MLLVKIFPFIFLSMVYFPELYAIHYFFSFKLQVNAAFFWLDGAYNRGECLLITLHLSSLGVIFWVA